MPGASDTSPDICAVCAWRADCKKKFSMSGRDMHCADFSRDVTLGPDTPEEADESKNNTGDQKT